jgi:hypothetical protein
MAALMICGSIILVQPSDIASARGWKYLRSSTSGYSAPAATTTTPTTTTTTPTTTTTTPAATTTAPAATTTTPAATTTAPAAATTTTTTTTTSTTPAAAVTAGVSCKTLGMVPNDASKAQNNYKLMLAAIKSGKTIIVDDVYYLDSIYWSAVDGNLINSDMVIKGTDKTKNKLILKDGVYFNMKGNATIQGISIEGIATGDSSFLLDLNAPYRLSVNVDSNYITGNVRLLSSHIPTTFDFGTTDCGITELNITNNEFYDVYVSAGAESIIYVNDTPVTTTRINNNKVTNFSYIFYDNQVTNDSPNADYIYAHSRNMYMEDNIVKCTDDYDAIARNNGKFGYYYCFAITEMNTVECRRNTFEGFHVINSPDTVVYDNYFSVFNLTYEDNTWKNIVNFTPGLDYVDIMKSKNGKGAEHPTRIYRGNHYITEAAYADKFGQDRYLLRKEMDTFQTWIESVIIEDNTFDMYILSSPRYKMAVNYTFSNNTMNLYTQESANLTQAYVGILEYRDAAGNLVPRQITFTNNKITTLNPPLDGMANTYARYIIDNEAGSASNVTLTFQNNYIKTYNVNSSFNNGSRFAGTKTISNNSILNNNQIINLQ